MKKILHLILHLRHDSHSLISIAKFFGIHQRCSFTKNHIQREISLNGGYGEPHGDPFPLGKLIAHTHPFPFPFPFNNINRKVK